jgi:hypothetical protein
MWAISRKDSRKIENGSESAGLKGLLQIYLLQKEKYVNVSDDSF